MIPRNFAALNDDFEISTDTSATKTYKLSPNKIQGFTDGLDALQQAIYKELDTEKYEYPIYGFNYGIELESLVGKDPAYAQIELKRRIKECLLQDEKITSVDNFLFTITGDEMSCTFNVTSIYGDLTITKEVNV